MLQEKRGGPDAVRSSRAGRTRTKAQKHHPDSSLCVRLCVDMWGALRTGGLRGKWSPGAGAVTPQG